MLYEVITDCLDACRACRPRNDRGLAKDLIGPELARQDLPTVPSSLDPRQDRTHAGFDHGIRTRVRPARSPVFKKSADGECALNTAVLRIRVRRNEDAGAVLTAQTPMISAEKTLARSSYNFV